jgi:hypothetical protein
MVVGGGGSSSSSSSSSSSRYGDAPATEAVRATQDLYRAWDTFTSNMSSIYSAGLQCKNKVNLFKYALDRSL